MQLETLLNGLGEVVGLVGIGLNENGVCSLSFNQEIRVNIERDDERDRMVHVYSILCEIPSGIETREKLFSSLLQANLFGRGTGPKARFALDQHAGEIILHYTFHEEQTDIGAFLDDIQTFVNLVEIWDERLKTEAQ